MAELLHVTLLHAVDYLEIGTKSVLILSFVKELSARNLTKEQLHENQEFLGLESETEGSNFWSLSECEN